MTTILTISVLFIAWTIAWAATIDRPKTRLRALFGLQPTQEDLRDAETVSRWGGTRAPVPNDETVIRYEPHRTWRDLCRALFWPVEIQVIPSADEDGSREVKFLEVGELHYSLLNPERVCWYSGVPRLISKISHQVRDLKFRFRHPERWRKLHQVDE